jgi:hypothetical protein
VAHELHAEDRQAIGGILSLHGLSKGLMLRADGTLASVTHLDALRRHDGGWRISRRVISPQPTPLGGARLAGAGDR